MAGEEQADDDPKGRQHDGSGGVGGLPGVVGAVCGHAKRLLWGKEVDGSGKGSLGLVHLAMLRQRSGLDQ
ncbi:hypothetical protein GCM10010519_31110 [Streptomyces lactacystinicus]